MSQCNNGIIYSAKLFHVGVRLILIYLSLLHSDNTSEFPLRFHLGLPYNAGISVNITPFCHLFDSLKGNYTQFFTKSLEAAPWFIFRIPHMCTKLIIWDPDFSIRLQQVHLPDANQVKNTIFWNSLVVSWKQRVNNNSCTCTSCLLSQQIPTTTVMQFCRCTSRQTICRSRRRAWHLNNEL